MTPRRWLAAFASGLMLLAAVPASAGAQYFYDSAGRLIKVVYSNGITIQYRYDAAGNRTEILADEVPNTAPEAVNDTASVNASASVNILVRANDTDADANSLVITAVTTPTGGTASIQGGGTYIKYTAPSGAGTYTFTYTISDGAGGTDTATVTVTSVTVNTAPVAVDDTGGTPLNTSMAIMVLGNDTDVDANTLTVTGVTTPTGGTVSIASGGAYVIYTAPATLGTYTFNYTVSDGAGGTDVGQVTVEVYPGEVEEECGEFELC